MREAYKEKIFGNKDTESEQREDTRKKQIGRKGPGQ